MKFRTLKEEPIVRVSKIERRELHLAFDLSEVEEPRFTAPMILVHRTELKLVRPRTDKPDPRRAIARKEIHDETAKFCSTLALQPSLAAFRIESELPN